MKILSFSLLTLMTLSAQAQCLPDSQEVSQQNASTIHANLEAQKNLTSCAEKMLETYAGGDSTLKIVQDLLLSAKDEQGSMSDTARVERAAERCKKVIQELKLQQ